MARNRVDEALTGADPMDVGPMDVDPMDVVLMVVATTVRGVVDRRWPVVDRVEIVVPVPVVQAPVVRERGIRCLGGSRIWNASSQVYCKNCISYANKSTVGKVADPSDPIRLDVVPVPVGIVKVARRWFPAETFNRR